MERFRHRSDYITKRNRCALKSVRLFRYTLKQLNNVLLVIHMKKFTINKSTAFGNIHSIV